MEENEVVSDSPPETVPEPAPAPAPAPAPEQAAEEEYLDPLHIGNTIEITSDKYGYVTGRVVYRDAVLMRLMPQEVSDRALDFPLTGDGMEFSSDLGVSVVEVIATQDSDYYTDLLGAQPGETLEFFTTDGTEAAPNGIVAEVVRTGSKDNILLTDGRTLRFRGRGPQPPIAVIRVRTALNVAAATEEGAPDDTTAKAAVERQSDVLALLRAVLPTAEVAAVPTAERGFPDSLQREDLFQDLLTRVKPKLRKQFRTLRGLEREVDIAVSLKNTAVKSGGASAPVIESLEAAVKAAKTGEAVSLSIPVVTGARILNLDEHTKVGTTTDGVKATDVVPRILTEVEVASDDAASMFESGTSGRGFNVYTTDLFSRDQITLDGPRSETGWQVDQDVIRTAPPETAVQGLSRGLPNREDENKVSEAYLQNNVEERTLRLLKSDIIYPRKMIGGIQIATSDPDNIAAWTILPIKAALRLRPSVKPGHLPTAMLYSTQLEDNNLPTITETIRALAEPEASINTVWTMTPTGESHALADWLRLALKTCVHPAESLGPRMPVLLSVLDTLGIGNSDLAPAIAEVVADWVSASQKQWKELFRTERQRIRDLLKTVPKREFPGTDEPVWATLRQTPALSEVMADGQRRNPAIFAAPAVITATLLTEAQGDALPIVWNAIGVAVDDIAKAKQALDASRSYQLRRAGLRGAALLGLSAAPEINTCVHVNRLEAIRNITDVVEAARLLQEFVDEFQGGKRGDWVTCALCQQDCVCYHELIELEALAQPTRGDAIHRQVMVRFGGDRYEGKIICRNCGQPLQDIDYDEHVEFDDEGRAIIETSVLTAEQQEEIPTESTWRAATAALVAGPIAYATESQRALGEALTTILERAGATASEAVHRQIVRYADLYVSARAPTQAAYDAQRTRLLTSAATRIKAGTAAPDVPTYAAVIDQLRVVALTATLGIALQIADPPIQVANPFPLCRFSRSGWPAEAEAKPDSEGALSYIACVVASIQREAAPWRNVAWAAEPKLESRRKKALTTAIQAAQIILGVDAKGSALSFTPEVRTALTRTQTDKVAAKKRAQVTQNDRIPAQFRPEPHPPMIPRTGAEIDPLPNVEAATAEGTAAPAGLIESVSEAIHRAAISTVTELHMAAAAGSEALQGSKVTDSVCCPVAMTAADTDALLLGVPYPGAKNLKMAARLLQSAQPTVPRAGTHLWTQEADHTVEPVEREVDSSLLFQLFLKYCYTGPQPGAAHEFSVGDRCRQCGFRLGVAEGDTGAAILASQEGDLRVEPTEAAFDALSDAVRRRKLLMARKPAQAAPWLSGLQQLAKVLSATESHRICGEALAAVLANPEITPATPLDELGRAQLWTPVSALMDALRTEVADAIGPTTPSVAGQRAQARAREAVTALDTFDALTEDPFIEGPRAIQEYWCAKTQAAGAGWGVRAVKGAAWSALSQDHNNLVNKILRDNADWFGGTIEEDERGVLRSVAQNLGPALSAWIRNVRRPDISTAWTLQEGQTLLRCLVLKTWRDAVVASSSFYESMPGPAERIKASTGVGNWTRALMYHVKQQFVRYSRDKIAAVLQERAELERTSVVEEFQAIKDDDERAAELIKKQLRMGRWGVAAKGWSRYDPELYEFENEQRKRMGIVDPPVDPILLESTAAMVPVATTEAAAAAAAIDFGLGALDTAPEEGYDVSLGAAGDDY